jgi:uncharacterized membrane protein
MKDNLINSISNKLTYLNGGFYSNSKDPRIMVPKSRPALGWNLNYGNPKAVILFVIATVIIVGIVVAFSMLTSGN